ncbi:signal peptidase I [Streptomyces sp. SM10]|uniref:signal peptidase I n=1 Tax=Streptomyces sp. SM10 TaxID=565556 RepID=UPI0021562401|nr:signal peptidase I [Streptomyces sp. SM10]
MGQAGRGLRIAAWASGVVGALLLVGPVVLFGFFYTTAQVTGSSMEPTYPVGERVVIERTGPGEIRRGEVVLYRAPDRYEGGAVLGRVIGTGGDRVAQLRDEPVTVNGTPLTEPYVKDGDPSGTALAYDVAVPEGRLFILGDFRGNARDSRYFLDDRSGTVSDTSVLGRASSGRGALAGLGLTMLIGALLTVTALVSALAARSAGQRERRWVMPPPPLLADRP